MKAVIEKVITEDESSIRAFEYSKSSFDAPWHIHPEYELTLINSSSGIRYVGNNISDYKAGELVLIGSNLPHCWKDENDQAEVASSLVIQWPEELMDSLKSFRKIQLLMENASRGVLFKNIEREDIQNQIMNVIEASSLNRYINLVSLLSSLTDLVDRELLAGASYAYDLSKVTNSRIEKVQQYVSLYYPKKIKLSDLADELNMSEQSFSRFFSKTMQRPFFVYLNEYRINRASRMLLETEMQVAEIGFKCGYDSLPFFYQQFKKFKNYSPLGFRKMYRII
ncbi:MAG: AraC family transcriptional regulator [Reichenbachiella sp.]